MQCTSPVRAYQTVDASVIFNDFGRADVVRSLDFRCGRCIGCRLTSALKWSVRCTHEAKLYGERNSFITLTVDDAHADEVFPRESLAYRPFQLFEKRLRWKLAQPVRFRMCGEYGEHDPLGREFGRPHYHALEFNLWPDDARKWRKSGDGWLYRSAELEKLWPFGMVEFGRAVPQAVAYVNSYIAKKLGGDLALERYRRVDPDSGEIYHLEAPFAHSSTVPPIGIEWFKRFKSDFVNADAVVLAGGARVGMPKAYDNWLDRFEPDTLEELKSQRELQGEVHRLMYPGEDSAARLAVKDECMRARVKSKQRVGAGL